MNVTNVRVVKVEDMGTLKAFASIALDDALVIDGFKIVETDGNAVVFYPEKSKKNADGTYSYRDIAFATKKELRDKISNAIMDAYKKA